MRIKTVVTRKALAGFGVSALAAAVIAVVPTAAQALPIIKVGTPVNFGVVSVGSSADRSVTISNAGNPAVPEDTAINFSTQVFGDPSDPQFTVLNANCFAPSLPGGQSCNDIKVRYTPASSAPATATMQIAMLYFQDTDPGPGQTLAISQRLITITLIGNVLCGGQEPTIFGTAGNDNISGTAGNDVIATFDGDDTVSADGGNDIVCGGADSDTLKGGTGKDKLYGESGGDVLKGGKGTDTCIGGLGLDRAKKCEKVGSL